MFVLTFLQLNLLNFDLKLFHLTVLYTNTHKKNVFPSTFKTVTNIQTFLILFQIKWEFKKATPPRVVSANVYPRCTFCKYSSVKNVKEIKNKIEMKIFYSEAWLHHDDVHTHLFGCVYHHS